MHHDLHVGMGQEECPESLGEEELPAPKEGPMHRVADTNLRDRNDRFMPSGHKRGHRSLKTSVGWITELPVSISTGILLSLSPS